MKKVIFVLLFTTAVSAIPSEALAGCFEDLANCYYRAATRSSWGSRWLAGLDCELEFVSCTRKALVGR